MEVYNTVHKLMEAQEIAQELKLVIKPHKVNNASLAVFGYMQTVDGLTTTSNHMYIESFETPNECLAWLKGIKWERENGKVS